MNDRILRDTKYAKEIATAEVDHFRIEKIFVKELEQEEIRFAWWPDGEMANRPLDLPEGHLLELISEGIKNGVFSREFLRDLHTLLFDVRLPDSVD